MPDLGTADSIGCKESQSNFKNPRRTKCSVDIFKDSLGFSGILCVHYSLSRTQNCSCRVEIMKRISKNLRESVILCRVYCLNT